MFFSATKSAKLDYYSALRKQKKQHWAEFLDKSENIWNVDWYIDNNHNLSCFVPISLLQISATSKITTNPDIAWGFLAEFFLPLSEYFLALSSPSEIYRHQLLMPPILLEEIAKAVFSTLLLKGVGLDTIPILV